MTPLEQFNEEVMKEFDGFIDRSEIINSNFIKNFITKTLAAHKELILKMVREKVKEGYVDYEELQNGIEEMIEPNWTISPIEFLNNLDTL